MNKKTIKIYIEGGCLLDVTNLPPGYNYQLIDYDNEETTKKPKNNNLLNKPGFRNAFLKAYNQNKGA